MIWLLACTGDDPAPPATDDCGTWASVGEPFALTWCTGCHSSHLADDARHGAPSYLNFDTLDAMRTNAGALRAAAIDGRSMPPGGGPSDAEKARMAAWIECGAPGEASALPVGTPTEGLLWAGTTAVSLEEVDGVVVLSASTPDGARSWSESYLVGEDGETGWFVGWSGYEGDTLTVGATWSPPLQMWDHGAGGFSVNAVATDLVTGETRAEVWTQTLQLDDDADPRSRDLHPDTVVLSEANGEEHGWHLSATRSMVYRWHGGLSFQQDGLGGESFNGLAPFPVEAPLGWTERVLERAEP